MKFRAKSEHAQTKLSDDDLVAYLVAARDAGQDEQVRSATAILSFGRSPVLGAIVRNRLVSATDEDVEDIVSTVIEQTIKARFDGKHAGQFFSLMLTILDRRIIDFIDRQSRQPRIAEGHDDKTSPFDLIADNDDPIGASALRLTLERLLGQYSERDRMVIEMRIDGIPSKEVAGQVRASEVVDGREMTFQNVDQIYKRFKDRHRDELDPGDGGAQADDGGEGSK